MSSGDRGKMLVRDRARCGEEGRIVRVTGGTLAFSVRFRGLVWVTGLVPVPAFPGGIAFLRPIRVCTYVWSVRVTVPRLSINPTQSVLGSLPPTRYSCPSSRVLRDGLVRSSCGRRTGRAWARWVAGQACPFTCAVPGYSRDRPCTSPPLAPRLCRRGFHFFFFFLPI